MPEMQPVTLVFTDVVDSTLLVERLGDERAAQVWAAHDRCARDLMALHGGREIDRTDGFFLLFNTMADAARYAMAYHEALAELELQARVGLHVGPVTQRENPAHDVARGAKRIEVEGLAKPFAARIMALARGGQTLLSPSARTALGAALADSTTLESHGHYRLKGVEDPVELFELGQLASAFAPPADTDKAYRVVRSADLWRPLREVRHNLPAERDAFIGRATELRALAQRLDAGARLVTVLGPGGTGKTRFVRRYGHAWLGDWPGGVCFCDLSDARSLDGVLGAVAVALDVPLGKGDPVVQLGHAMAGRGRCLVILDNFEQVLAHAPATLGHWLDRAGEAAFIVTSRERLQLGGEVIFPVEPLPLNKDAIELFEARARAQRPDFAIGDANREAVAEVVRLLDGLPLAIELAAARVRVMSPAQLALRMRDRFALLSGARGAAARQATLRAVIDWSWDLLTAWEQAALAQCSVFEGGFTLDAAEDVLDLARWPEAPSAMDTVQALLDKSLLRTWSQAEAGRYDIDEPYFGMYISIHEYAVEKLGASGEQAVAQAEDRHARHFAGFGTEEALEALSRHGGVGRRRTLALELDNLVAACRRAVRRGHGETAVAVYRAAWEVLDIQGPLALGVTLGAQVLALDGIGDSARAAACAIRALASRRSGHMGEASAWFVRALKLARKVGNRRTEAIVFGNLALLRHSQGRMVKALAHYEKAIVIHRALGNTREEAGVLGNLGNLHIDQGRMELARAHYEAALAIHREVGNRRSEGSTLDNLGSLHNEQGRIDDARTYYEAALAIAREVGNRRGEGTVLGNLGNVLSEQGQTQEAWAAYEAALAIDREVGSRRDEGIVLGHLGILHHEEGRMAQAWAHQQQALAIARELDDRRTEGFVLSNLGDLLTDQGRIAEAREALRAGESRLREVGDLLMLAMLLCTRGRAEASVGESDLAHSLLAEAEAVAVALGTGRDSGLALEIDRLRAALA
jgi:predicted ATPase/class 3 adenylate cyclase/Tfp pilus assembly protein PilF